MDSSQASRKLIDQADECLRLLQDLIERAKEAHRTHRIGSTSDLLTNVDHNAKNSSRLLQTWKRDFGKGRMTNDQQPVNTTNGLFENLRHWIETAYYALDSRLVFRKIFIIGFITSKREHFEKRLKRAFHNIDDTSGKLNAQLKILLVEPTGTAADRQSKVLDVRREAEQPYRNFCQFFEKLGTEDKGNIRSLALKKLWEHLRDPIPDLDGKVGNAEDPGDGLLYGPEHINRANALLKDLHQAWTNAEDCSLHPPPEKLPKMGMICLILAGMRQQRLLEDFLDSMICDDDLHLSRSRLQQVLRKQHHDYVGTFLSEQYRAKLRLWDDGHARMEDEEPLPFVYGKPYKEGSYGIVTRVHDPFSEKVYALKQQIIGSAESHNARARKHLKDETERLKKLEHKHVIKLVKSYERADAYGLLLSPAATSDLIGLLDRFHKNKFCAPERCTDQVWLRPIFLTAFGCLSQGLAYIHGKEIRHKDIKPGNILYEKAMRENGGARFLWADFGLAYDFSATGNSKTDSTKIYSKRYAAPEILKASINPSRTDRRASVMSLNRIMENGEARQNVDPGKPEEKILSEFRDDEETSHGRKTDVFSLGCVFLELLAVLIQERLPMDHGEWSFSGRPNGNDQQLPDGGRIAAAPIASSDDMFCRHIKELKEWAQLHSDLSNPLNHDPSKTALAPLFTLAADMISRKAEDRPLIDEVVEDVAAIGKHHFCQSCWAELPAEQEAMKSPESPAAAAFPANEKIAKPKRVDSATPDSPTSSGGTPMSLLRRSTAIFRVDSYGPRSQLMKIGSR
ncbi:MAG: hypothetical protein Q9190_003297 [Brigantiaea leucoxantha]